MVGKGMIKNKLYKPVYVKFGDGFGVTVMQKKKKRKTPINSTYILYLKITLFICNLPSYHQLYTEKF